MNWLIRLFAPLLNGARDLALKLGWDDGGAKPATIEAVAARMGADVAALTTLQIVTRRDAEGRLHYQLAPAEMYAVAVPAVVRALRNGVDPGGALSQYFQSARTLPPEAWELALIPTPEFFAEYPPGCEERHQRAYALQLAQRWFIEHLHQESGGNGRAIHVSITKDPNWRG